MEYTFVCIGWCSVGVAGCVGGDHMGGGGGMDGWGHGYVAGKVFVYGGETW